MFFAIFFDFVIPSCDLPLDVVWPPSEKSQKVTTTFLVISTALLVGLFRRQRTSQKARQVIERRLAHLCEGQRLLLESVYKRDQLGEGACSSPKDWEEGLPETCRVMGYLWDDTNAQPTTQLGLKPDDNHTAVKRLFNRALRAELQKAKVFTIKARQLEQEGVLANGGHGKSQSGSTTDCEEWLKSYDSNLEEVTGFLSGEKLECVIEIAENAQKNLGKQIIETSTKVPLQQCKTVCKDMQIPRFSAFKTVFDIAVRVAPLWLLSNAFFVIHIMGWTEFDRVLFSGEIGLKPLRSDGSYDSMLGFQLACNCVVTCVVWWVAHAISETLIQKTTALSTLLLKSRLVECLLFQDYAYFEIHNAGKLQALVNEDAQEVSENLFSLTKEMIGALSMIVIKLVACFQIAPATLVLQCLAPIPLVAFINKKMMDYGSQEEKKASKIQDQVSANINDVLSNLRTVRTFANEVGEVSRFQGCIEQQTVFSLFAHSMQSVAISVFIFCITASVAWSTYLAGKTVAAGEMHAADVTVFSINMLHQVHMWQNFFNVVPRLQKMMRPLNRIMNLMKSESKIEPNPNNSSEAPAMLQVKERSTESDFTPSRLVGEIRFENVRFHYPTDLRKQVLSGMTFEIKPGQKVGICGSAGCGKTTTIDLLQRLYDVDAGGGAVYLDGVDIRHYDVHFLRRRIGVVAQKTVLFKSTVRENIWYGMDSFPGDAAVEEALKQAQAWDFIQEKPDQLLTMLTETGGGFSGGQMQRLAIARCLIRNPDIILLDEATAALDPVNERFVQDAIDQVTSGRYTTLAIAHRLTTIKDADKIIVLDKGRVVESGSHAELMKKTVLHDVDDQGKKRVRSGFYRNQWQTQFNERLNEFDEGVADPGSDSLHARLPVRQFASRHSTNCKSFPAPPPLLLARAATTA